MAVFPPDSGATIVISGDSISDAQKWANYLQCYYYLHYPGSSLTVLTAARSGTSSAGWNLIADYQGSGIDGSEYERQVYPLSPDIVFLMLGHNDGVDTTAQLNNTQAIVDDWIIGVSGAVPVLVGAHPTWSTDGKPVIGNFNDNYQTVAEGATPDWLYAKIWDELLTPATTDYGTYSADSANSKWQQFGGTNSIHPGTGAHISIVRAALHLLGADTLVSSATIAANTNTTTASSECTISALSMTASGGTFARLDARLPMAIDEAGRANADARYTGFTEDYLFAITGLNAGDYELACGGVVIGTYSNVELAAGVNLATATIGPIFDQIQETLGCVRDLQGVNRSTLVDVPSSVAMKRVRAVGLSAYQNGDQRGQTYFDTMTVGGSSCVALLASYITAVRSAATPVNRTWSVTSVSGASPVVTITTPASPPSVFPGTPITFDATATDAEDGNIATDISWSSSLDGALGTGATVSPTLSVGSHVVTASVLDSDTNEGFDQIIATVGGSALTVTTLNVGTLSVG